MLKVFVDDLRVTNSYDLVFREPELFLSWLKDNTEQELFLSLDNDMGLEHLDGKAVVKELVIIPNNIKQINLHTSNFIARDYMKDYLNNAKACGLLPNLDKVSVSQELIC
jgi:hypothetical protein